MAHNKVMFGGSAREKVLRGATLLSDDLLGRAGKVVVDKEKTSIVNGAGKKQPITGRCTQIRKQMEDTSSDYDREKRRERLAKLSGGVAVIRVGAPSEAEMKARKEALDDAISATKAAVAEGIVPGGGLARQIAANSAVDGGVVVARMLESQGNFVFYSVHLITRKLSGEMIRKLSVT